MSFRTRIFGAGADLPLLRSKTPRGAQADVLGSVIVPRSESRRGNARGCDRHRLISEEVTLRHHEHDHLVELVNLSGGGAMIRGELDLVLWDHVALVLGEGGEIECAVRWLKDNLAGLEFAHETRIECDHETHDELLRAVIRKSFPDAQIKLQYPGHDAENEASASPPNHRRADRHPLVWTGIIYYHDCHDFGAEPVRLRNISMAGALVQSGNPLPNGDTVYLDIRGSGRHAATVKWTRGDQAGLEFHAPFDLHSLAHAEPEIASAQHATPTAFGNQGPWAPGWKRSTISELARNLGA